MRLELQREIEAKKYNTRLIKIRKEKRKEQIKRYLNWSKHQDKLRFKQVNKTLMEHLKKIEIQGMEERKRQIAFIKEQTKVPPFKIQCMQLRREVKLKELMDKEIKMNKTAVNEKEKELEYLAKLESELKEQLVSVKELKFRTLKRTYEGQYTKSNFSFASIKNLKNT